MIDSLIPLFKPRSVAVIGASRQAGTIGNEILRNLLRCGFQGVVYPVNPHAHAVHAVRASPSVLDLPEPVDLAVVAVPAARVIEVARQCAQAGVKAMVVISAGFKEAGEQGARLEEELTTIARDAGIRIVGPNCLGVINASDEVRLDATFAPTFPTPGRVGFLTQSGALGVAILDTGEALGLGLSTFVSIGNKADVSANDMLEYWEEDPDTALILLYLESFGNPRKFSRIARRVAARKPIIAVKSGRSASGRRAATSHTGALAGVDVAADALFWQTGVIRVDTMEELFNTALLLAHQPVPRGRRVAVLTNAGGPGILAADACEAQGLTLPQLSEHTRARLSAFLPPEASVRNPVDMIASASPEAFERAVRILLEDDDIDSLIAIFVPPIVTRAQEVAEAIKAGASGSHKTILCNFLGSHGVPESLRSLQAASIPSFTFPETAAITLGRAARYGEWLSRPSGAPADLPGIDADAAAQTIQRALAGASEGAAGLWLSPDEIAEVLGAYGIRQARQRTASTADEAASAASHIGFPVALKLISQTLTHKTDVGGVRLGLRTPEEVWDAFAGMARRLEVAGHHGAMQGVLVQEMVPEGVEIIAGASLDPALGMLLMVGLGGVHAEIFKDVAVRVHPLEDIDASEMIAGLRAAPLLKGYRGAPPADTGALAELLLRLDRLISDHPQIVDLDLNPLKVLHEGQGVVAVDARIRVQPTEAQRFG